MWLFGGVSLSVQTLVAHDVGAKRYTRASQATWTALWASALTIPLFTLVAFVGHYIFDPFGMPADTQSLALDYWKPRMLGGPLAVGLMALLGFFNGVGLPMVTLQVTLYVTIANAILNQVLMFNLGMGVAGSGWATTAAQFLGIVIGLFWFLGPTIRQKFRSHLTNRLKISVLLSQCRVGLPVGVQYAADILAFAVFQLVQVRLGAVAGAATQVVMVLTSFCYSPAIGFAMAGTTLVGQSIGSGHRDWAYFVGTSIIKATVAYMTIVGVLLAAAGPWILPFFANASDSRSPALVGRGLGLLWIAAAYQFFDALNIGAGACLRGAGDTLLPSVMGLLLSICFFAPLAQIMAFGPDNAWIGWLPHLDFGAIGGWFAALIYIVSLGLVLFFRWRSQAWRRVVLT
jgi:MATE family multidrug resistance protein